MKLSLGKILAAVSCLLGLVAILMLFAPGVSYEVLGKTANYNMLKITFGYKESVPVVGEMEVLKFSFLNLLTYILILAGMVTAGLALKGDNGKILSLVSAALFIVGAVFYFCAVQFVVLPGESDAVKASDLFDLGSGAIVGGVLSILAAACVVVPAFLKKK